MSRGAKKKRRRRRQLPYAKYSQISPRCFIEQIPKRFNFIGFQCEGFPRKPLISPLRAHQCTAHSFCDSYRDRLSLAIAASLASALSLLIFSEDYWASPSPPIVRVARGEGHPPRATARGLASGGGARFLGIDFIRGRGWRPKVDLSKPRRLGPFLSSFFFLLCHAGEGLITASPVPGTS